MLRILDKDYFICDLCKAPFENKLNHDEHFKYHTGHRYQELGRFGCDICRKVFKSYEELNCHLWLHFGMHTCRYCDEKLPTVMELKLHKKINHGVEFKNDKKVVSCYSCHKKFSGLKTLKRHSNVCLSKRHHCEICNIYFSNVGNLMDHMKLHDSPEAYKCSKCPKVFKNLNKLLAHQIIHEDSNVYQCEICLKKCFSSSSLYDHKVMHNNMCQKCPKKFKNPLALERHKKLHEISKECKICNMPFQSDRALAYHEKLHENPDQFKCQICSKRFTTAQSLNTHQQMHSNIGAYNCKQCPKTFQNYDQFAEHEKFHINPELFKCQECSKIFMTSDKLKCHQFVHTEKGLAKVTCQYCSGVFSSKWHTINHEKRCKNIMDKQQN